MSELEMAKRAWASTYAGLSKQEIELPAHGFAVMVRAMAEEGALRPERFAELMGRGMDESRQLFSGLSSVGLQLDADGRIVGAAQAGFRNAVIR